jgi:hypothetical protein
MRLNKNTYPAFIALEQGDFMNLQVDECILKSYTESGKKIDSLIGFMNALYAIFKQSDKRYYITEPFKQAIITAAPKIREGAKQINEIPNDCGVIFTSQGFTVYLSNPADKEVKLVAYGFTRTGLTTFAFLTNDNNYGGTYVTTKDGKVYDDNEGLVNYINSLLTTIYFIHNCEIEQKIVKPQEKYRSAGEKHFNESKSNIIILDCRWFTELIRTTAFHVRGHLRWQVHGEGRAKRKLIWIEDFEKTGYHRKAQKI